MTSRRIALAVLACAAAACGRREPDLRIHLPDGYGVEERTQVRYMGVDVGNVTGIRFAPDGVVFEVALRRRDVPLRAADSVHIGDRGILGGGGIIEIYPGPAGAKPVPRGGTLVGRAQQVQDDGRTLQALAGAAALGPCRTAPDPASARRATDSTAAGPGRPKTR